MKNEQQEETVLLKAPQKSNHRRRLIREKEEPYFLLCPQRPPGDVTATHAPAEGDTLPGGASPFCGVLEAACSPSEPGPLLGLPRERGGIRDSVPPTPLPPLPWQAWAVENSIRDSVTRRGGHSLGAQRRLPETLTSHTVNSAQGARLLGPGNSQDVASRLLSPLKPAFTFSFLTSSI